MPGEVQAVRATARWPADRGRFRAGWDDGVAAAALPDGTRPPCELRTGETVAWDVRTGARVATG